ncbi:DUF6934 family protein [Dyadobacter sp. OTU695]|uniref:DUF6934 family protein n=1 Tax=Dyadobacter sp. OTU695 TaxID=3043860 RepID=UPI00313B41FB
MDLERYKIDQLSEFGFRFYSNGPKGAFKMHVRFSYLGRNIFNLGFGVVESASGRLNDLIEVRNGDSKKILATVAAIALEFMEDHPGAVIYATGSTPSRTRLYQMGINRILPTLEQYQIVGSTSEDRLADYTESARYGRKPKWQEVELGKSYKAFLLFDPAITNLEILFNI